MSTPHLQLCWVGVCCRHVVLWFVDGVVVDVVGRCPLSQERSPNGLTWLQGEKRRDGGRQERTDKGRERRGRGVRRQGRGKEEEGGGKGSGKRGRGEEVVREGEMDREGRRKPE